MSDLIPIKIVNLALDAKDLQIKTIADQCERANDLLKQEQERVNVLLGNNYRLRNAVISAIDLMDNNRTFTDDERLSLQNLIRGSLG
jgi:hypothetical protein